MAFNHFSFDKNEKMDREELKENLEDLEFQLLNIQDHVKQIAKKWNVIGIEQTKEENWVIVYTSDRGENFKIMVDDCKYPFRGWDFSLQAYYKDDNTIHIGDITGPENKGYGSICMKYLKEVARNHNIQSITGDIAKRDWDHKDRLVYFYKKHDFEVSIDRDQQSGEIEWNVAN